MVNTDIPTPEQFKAMSPNQRKAFENRLRASADRQGFQFLKSRTRDPRALDYDTYDLIDTATQSRAAAFGLLSGYGLSLEQVAWYLLGAPPTVHVNRNPDQPINFGDTNGQPILSHRPLDGWTLSFEPSWCYANRDVYKRPVPRDQAGRNPEEYGTSGLEEDELDDAIKDAQEYLRRIGYREPDA